MIRIMVGITHPTKHRGFTLIEIMVVLIIVAIVASMAILAVGDFGQKRRIKNETQHLQMLIELAEQQAMLAPTTMGLSVDANGYQFYHYVLDPQKNTGQWQQLTKDLFFRPGTFATHTYVSFNVKKTTPQIIISPNGELTPFTLHLGTKDNQNLFQLIGKRNGEVKFIAK